MKSFHFDDCPDPIRSDLVEAYQKTWKRIAGPGTWLTGAERVAIADETRRAVSCAICLERREAISPFAVQGKHDHAGILSEAMVDEIHRITTDAARLTQAWYRSLLEEGLTSEAYVEALGVAVCVLSIDRFHRAMGLPLEPLPGPLPGEPTRIRPKELVEGEAWVPLQPADVVAAERGLPAGQAPFVIRALSLVPEEVRAWSELSAAQYLETDRMMSFDRFRALSRSQIELVAGRVSALNECFY
jgi:alkylhydroperoxidase family enzyme